MNDINDRITINNSFNAHLNNKCAINNKEYVYNEKHSEYSEGSEIHEKNWGDFNDMINIEQKVTSIENHFNILNKL